MYAPMFKPSQNCRPPHVNIDVLRDDIFQSEFIAKRNITSADMLIKAIHDENVIIEKSFEKKAIQQKQSKAVEKARQNKFFLGLDKTWVHRDV